MDVAEDILIHYGVKRRSGRYPWGSGDNPYQRSGDFISRVQELKSQGLSEGEIVKSLGFESSTDYRRAYSNARNERARLEMDRAKSLQEDGLNTSQIARELGRNESTIRYWLNSEAKTRATMAQNTANALKEELKSKHMVDVGAGVERELGVSRTKLDNALELLQDEGYNVLGVGIPQPNNPSKRTTIKVLCEPGDSKAQQRSIYQDPSIVQSLRDYHTDDGGIRWDKREYPSSISSDRVKVRYGDEGGAAKDGVIEIRRGVQDLDLGKSHYAQVRIMVDGTHYLKGMAMYSDDIPDGVDIVFNTNKKTGTPKMDVLKPIQSDPDNPFGAYIKANGQYWYTDSNGNKKLGAINKLKEEGDWGESDRNLSSQFLSKQPMKLIKQQLDLTYADYRAEYDEIMSYTNPTVKRKLLNEFAGKCDSAAIHLKAAALPRQETRVILPITQLKENEVYAPYLNNGEHVALVRYPHGGTFEIPELVVNNRNPSAKSILGNATDAIGINAKVAERLSGADFDGDTVIVIPTNNRVRVKSTQPLEGLKDFDPKTQYAYHDGMKVMTKQQTQKQMGIVSNLITDMTLRGASEDELARAVRHSMVVIDAAKHRLDYKQSEKDNGIAELKQKYQPKYDDEGNVAGSGGASTLLSKRKQTVAVPERRGSAMIDKETGEIHYKESGRTYINSKGERVRAMTNVPRLLQVKDVRELSSGTPQEEAYAEYANRMRSLANTARKEYATTPGLKRSPTAAVTYKTEVASLSEKLANAEKNQPRERRAQVLANSVIKAKIQANPELADKQNKKELNKVKRMALDDARASVGASGRETRIKITDKEWEAIQMGAVSDTTLTKILRYSDPEDIQRRAMPRTTTSLSNAQIAKINSMKLSGYTIKEIADSLGKSTSTISNYLNS